MTIQLDTTRLSRSERASLICGFITPEHQYVEPKAGVEGVSFPAVPTLTRAITPGMFTSGATSTGSEPLDPSAYQDLRIDLVFPTDADQGRVAAAAEQYAQLRADMEKAGLPLLDDEDLRQEIRTRRGIRAEPEA
jgi:hypothetical protein